MKPHISTTKLPNILYQNFTQNTITNFLKIYEILQEKRARIARPYTYAKRARIARPYTILQLLPPIDIGV